MKYNFSIQSAEYARQRPSYPVDLLEYILNFVPHKDQAWDCDTGNGSQSQIDHAVRMENIIYSVQPAEHTTFPDDFFDPIVVAQAIHWFDFEAFYGE
jgi:hypothetical protein